MEAVIISGKQEGFSNTTTDNPFINEPGRVRKRKKKWRRDRDGRVEENSCPRETAGLM